MVISEPMVLPRSVAIVTQCSSPRVDHLRRQLAAIHSGSAPRPTIVVVWVGDDEPPHLDADEVVLVPPGPDGLRLATARNRGFDRAVARGAKVIVSLDADCIPGPRLVERYAEAASMHPRAVLCGPVTYLAAGADVSDSSRLAPLTDPHPARPNPDDGQVVVAAEDDYALFWSLSFAMTAECWSNSARFDERYEGYGGEDTDFAFSLLARGVALAWVGGAHAYHQYHPTTAPPWQHLDDILRNGRLFAEKWGRWPMEGWLAAFEEAGAIRRDGDGWART